MSDTKLCPYRKTFGEKYEDHQIEIDGLFKEYSIRGEIFGYCLQDKCAMWRAGALERANPEVHYFCGLAGKP